MQQKGLVPPSFEPLGMHADMRGPHLLEQVQRLVPQDGEVLGSMVLAHATPVFSKGEIQHPMQAVLNPPNTRVPPARRVGRCPYVDRGGRPSAL